MAAMTTSQPTNPLVGPLLTDFYQISMAYSYWRHNRHEVEGVFELYFRELSEEALRDVTPPAPSSLT